MTQSLIVCILYFSDDMVENENETLRDRVHDLEKRVHDQNDEITCLRATLADALRRINTLEDGKRMRVKSFECSRFFTTLIVCFRSRSS